jgi:hypothetical protein
MFWIFPLVSAVLGGLIRRVRPVRSASVSCVRNSPRACKKQRLVNRFYGHAHIQIIRALFHQFTADLLR